MALPYIVYLLAEQLFDVSGVVAVVSAGLTAGAIGRVRLAPDNWRYLSGSGNSRASGRAR